MARAAALTSALLLSLGTAAGCGSSKSAPKPTATSASTPTAGTASSPATSGPSPSATALSADDLEARLLTVADLPSGFSVDSDNADANGTISATDPRCRPLVDLMNSDGKPSGAVADADTSFTRSELGPNIATGLASFPSTQDAQKLMDSVTKAMRACTELTETDKDGTSYDFAVAPLESPKTGDAVGAIRMSADIGGYPAQIDIVLVRVGSTLLYVANTGLGDTDAGLTQDVVKRAVAKLQAAGTPSGPGA
ncbi:sensor domain-containing protein [Catenulispora subtropica]|uniref:PknH-like extracellular domain-containing protein n=1 Tax=Catenulispora subtropica TaxID=450798 RepID=A0ABP5CGR4_9ACTN